MKDLKIIFFGTPQFVVPILQSLHKNFNLAAAVTTPDAPVGRKHIITPTPVALEAERLGIQALKFQQLNPDNKVIEDPRHSRDSLAIEQLNNLTPDLFIVASYRKIIPKNILEIPKYGSLNVHPSKLPKYRGASPIQNTILNGDKETAITIIKMDEEVDHGPIVCQEQISLSEKDTFQSLHNNLFQASADLIVKIIPDFIEGKLKPEEQNHKEATFTDHIKREDGYFDINNPPSKEVLDRKIRAYYPWPTAWTKWDGKIVKFLPDQKVQMEGKNPVKLKEFLNGYKDFPLKRPIVDYLLR